MTADGADREITPSEDPEDLFRRLVESVSAVTYVLRFGHADEPPLYVSPQSERVVGFPASALMVDARGRNALLHPDDRDRIWRRAAALDREGGNWDEEYRIALPDGSFRWIHDQARVVPGDNGRPALWFGVLTDLTRTNEAERALADSVSRYRALIEQVPAFVYLATDEGDPDMSFVSPQTMEMMGFSSDEWLADQDLWWKLVLPEHREQVRATWLDAVEHGDRFECEYPATRRDGSEVWLHDSAQLVHPSDGSPPFWQGMVVDVTEAKRAEEYLRSSEARYRTLVEQVPALVYVDSNDTMPASLYVSPQVEAMLGYPPESYLADREFWWRTMHADDRTQVEAGWIRSVSTGEPFHAEYRFIRPDGAEVWVIDDARLIRGAEGEAVHWQGVIQDITVRKRREEELSATSARFRALVERTPGVVYETDVDDERKTLYVNPQVESLFGYSRREWLEQPDIWIELLHPDDREIVLAAHDSHNETGAPWNQEYRLIANDGRVVWVRDQAVVVRSVQGRPATWQGIMLDITPQKELEEELRTTNDELEHRVAERMAELAEANEMMSLEIWERRRIETELRETRERYRRLVEDIPAVVCVWKIGSEGSRDPSNYTGPRIEVLVGYRVDEWNDPALWASRLHPHDRDRVLAEVSRCETTGEPLDLEYRLLAKDGRIVWVLDHATLLSRDDAGKPMMYQGILLDITARKQAELHASEAEERLRTFAETGPVATMVYELVHEPERGIRVVYTSPQLADVLGREARTWILDSREQLLELVHPDDRDALVAALRDQWRTGADITREFRLIAPDGRIVWVHNEGRCIARDELGRPMRFHSMLLDITDRKAEEERIRTSEQQLRAFIERVPAIPWMELVEGEPGTGRIVFMGPQVEHILGYAPEELISAPAYLELLVHPDDRERIRALAAEHDRTEEPWWAEFRTITRDGRELWLRSEALASRDDQGRLIWHGVTFDVTDQKVDLAVTLPDVASADTPDRR